MVPSKLNSLTIRPCTRADLPIIQTIYNHYVHHTVVTFDLLDRPISFFESKFDNIAGHLPYLVITTNDPAHPSVLGYAYASPYSERSAYRHTVEIGFFVHPEYLGVGIGESLLDALTMTLTELKNEDGRPRIYQAIAKMSVNPSGKDAERFYLREGWDEVGRLRKVGWKFGKWIDIKVFQKGLREGDTDPLP